MEPAIAELVHQAVQAVIKKLHNETDKLNRLDAVSGDGDTGTAFSRAVDTLSRDITDGKLIFDCPSSLFRRIGLICESRMGGTSGASTIKELYFKYKIKLFFSLWSFLCCCC